MASDFNFATNFGVVIIGRNEGDRLKTCLTSVLRYTDRLVYVDSGSMDDSIQLATAMGVVVVRLDMTFPFTAARARNEGFRKLCDLAPNIELVQFVDGDCEVVDGWLNSAVSFLAENENIVVVCGRRRERFPDKSIYNLLCDIEWNTPVGGTMACGGDAMMRVKAFNQVGGFRENLIAGEEPDLCVRLRQKSWKIWRLDAEMTLHDAAISKFSQWWKRTTRAGYAFAEGACLHGKLPEKHWVKETRSALAWGLFVPLITISLTCLFDPRALLLLMAYPIQVSRLTLKGERGFRINFLHAFFLVLGKIPEMLGALKFSLHRILNTDSNLIEYK